ncbi:MAG: CinA family protein [Treponema sp.]|nr:CinA family protein [Treponema sp.]
MPECNIDTELIKQAEKTSACLIKRLKEKSFTIALAESCTAGLISALIAGTPGASSILWGSFVCYTKEAKVSMLGLNDKELDTYGLVSRETACSMAASALEKSGSSISAAVTGLAGPDGDGSGKNIPVGTVWIAVAMQNGDIKVKDFYFTGSRNEVRIRAAIAVLEEILGALPRT